MSPDTYWDLFLAYTAVWLILAVGCWRIGIRYRGLAERLRLLEDRIQRAADELPNP